MKRIIAAIALIFTVSWSAAKAECSLFIGEGTISRVQAQALAERIEKTLGTQASLFMQEETGEGVAMRLRAGDMPCIAVLSAEEAARWAREGLLLPLDGCVPEIERMAPALVEACVQDEQLMAAPLSAQRRMLAVRPDGFQAVNMGYLLDSRAHPVWYPSEFLQTLDEMALAKGAGMDVWAPEPGEMIWLEALLQGVSGGRFIDETTGAYGMEEEELALALEWLKEMLSAGLIETAQSREEALERFVSGETAVFADWTAEESERFAKAIKEEEILLRPYPSLAGMRRHAAQMTVICVFASEDEQDNAFSRRAVSLLLSSGEDTLWQRGLGDDGAPYFPLTGAEACGATLRSLLCGEVHSLMEGETSTEDAAGRITRAMRTAGY